MVSALRAELIHDNREVLDVSNRVFIAFLILVLMTFMTFVVLRLSVLSLNDLSLDPSCAEL